MTDTHRVGHARGQGLHLTVGERSRTADLRHSTDAEPGITRRRAGRGFRYLGPDGASIRDAATLARIRSLAVPPAWHDVWICPDARGHLQAAGRDARGRKQSRYHSAWRARRDASKFGRMAAFGRALPRLRRRVAQDLALTVLSKEKVLATVVRLLETTSMRIGTEAYARANGSFGLTTLRNRHVTVSGDAIRFSFRGKSGKIHEVGGRDRRLARVVARCEQLPGQELFQYLDEDGEPRPIESADVNTYLKDAAGIPITGKDFRTWIGTLIAFQTLRSRPSPHSAAAQPRAMVVRSAEAVAEVLGNTPAVSRQSYIAPLVVEAYLAGTLPRGRSPRRDPGEQVAPRFGRREELALVHFLERGLRAT
ncbi:MAG: DNA topoisomerase IB [Chloroflexi bacterium]|nr:DNA topoisomerase IB [Chloroflexota bacterium]